MSLPLVGGCAREWLLQNFVFFGAMGRVRNETVAFLHTLFYVSDCEMERDMVGALVILVGW